VGWGNVVTALITATATLTGVRLPQRHAVEQRRQDRVEDRRVEQRTALAEVLVTGREWTRSLDGLALSAAKMEEVTDS
jgi:hypothetical protein